MNDMPPMDYATELARLATLPKPEYDRSRIVVAKRFGMRTSTLDGEVKRVQASGRSVVDSWLNRCQRTEEGDPIPNLANAMLALREDARVADLFAYDEMLRVAMLMRPVPTQTIPDGAYEFQTRPVRDTDVTRLQEWLQKEGLPRLAKDTVHQAVDLRATERAFHPVRDYLDVLRWDGVPRVMKWLHVYLGAADTDYHTAIGKMFLIAMVARIYRPGCKADYMMVLEGPQGARKSTVCAILGGAWFSDSLPELHHGDAVRLSMHLRGKWLIEIAEMSSINKTEAGALKAFLTQTEERYIAKFARNEVIEPRQCTFVGTTNKTTYLRDETGGRRFWPAKVGTIDTEALKRDRDQLFAEAVHLYRNGNNWWPTQAFEMEHIAPEQEARYEADAWEDAIEKFLSGLRKTTVLQVAREGLHMDLPKIGTADQRRVAAAMERLGWARGERTLEGRWWVRRHDA
jgi:predicted P-loop ATPase